MSGLDIVAYLIDALWIIILARAILSWIIVANPSARQGFIGSAYQVLFQITEPLLNPIRNGLARLGIRTGMFDISPMVLIVILIIISEILSSVA
jgi:YggT family protein